MGEGPLFWKKERGLKVLFRKSKKRKGRNLLAGRAEAAEIWG